MRCPSHPERETSEFCRDCGSPACSVCLAGPGLCRRCAAERGAVDERRQFATTRTALPSEAPEEPRRRSWRDLSMLAKFLAVYVLVVAVVAGLPWGMGSFGGFTQTVLGWLGVAAGVLMTMARPAGWWLGLFWALAQALEVVVGGHALNRQCLSLGANFNVNGLGLGLNVVGVILVVLFVATRGQFLTEEGRA